LQGVSEAQLEALIALEAVDRSDAPGTAAVSVDWRFLVNGPPQPRHEF